MNAAILNDRLFHKESYGEEFYGDSTPLSKTFEDVCVINWSARSYFSGRNVVLVLLFLEQKQQMKPSHC